MMDAAALEGFSALEHEAKLQTFTQMLDLCSHHDHLSLHKELEARLSRDFLTLLPPEIAIMILSYLPVEGLVTGQLVCWGWREVISGATPLWRNAAREIGLSEVIVEANLPEYGSYMGLTLMALKHQNYISSHVSEVAMHSIESLHCEVHMAGSYIICSSDTVETVEIKQLGCDGSLVTLYSFNDPANRFKPQLLSGLFELRPFVSTDSNFVFWGNCKTGWIGWNDPRIPAPNSGLHVWPTDEVGDDYGDHSNSIATACPRCNIIVLVRQCASPTSKRFRVLLRRVALTGNSKVGECTLQLPCFPSSITVFPENFKDGMCGCHAVVSTRPLTVHSVPAESFFPGRSTSYVLPMVQIPAELADASNLLPSADGLIVVEHHFPESQQYHVWQPESGKVVAVPNCHFQSCIAIGHLYSILERESFHGHMLDYAVVTTYTGVVLLKGSMASELSRGDAIFDPPVKQQWLSSLDTPPENLPMATCTVWRGVNTEFIGAIVMHAIRL